MPKLTDELLTFFPAFKKMKDEVDRSKQELATYRHAFETTAADRDRIASLLGDIADPLDAGNFRLDFFPRFGSDGLRPNSSSLALEWENMFVREKFDDLVKSMFSNLSVTIAHQNSAEYFQPFASYYLACLFATHCNFARAQHYADMLTFDAPPDGANFLPYDLRQSSRLVRWKQDIAIQKGCPSVLIVSLMKSASALLTIAISQTFDVPVLRVSLGEGMQSVIVRKWAEQFARGGATTHEHFQAIDLNLNTLKDAGIREMWVQIRDPRDAAYSARKMEESWVLPRRVAPQAETNLNREEQFIATCLMLSQWIDGWVTASQTHDRQIEIKFITFREVTSDLAGAIRKIFAHCPGAADRAIDQWTGTGPNFRRGISGEWRDHYSSGVRAAVWSKITSNVRSVLDLSP